MAFPRPLILSFLAVGLAACGDPPATPAAPAPVAEAPAAAASTAASSDVASADSALWFEPATLSECGEGAVVGVHWNAARFAGVSTVEVSVVDKDGKETLFAAAGAEQQKDTGPWARAGLEFVLRDGASKRELQRSRIGTSACAAP